jgi:predicted PurR-regulated permease PerM
MLRPRRKRTAADPPEREPEGAGGAGGPEEAPGIPAERAGAPSPHLNTVLLAFLALIAAGFVMYILRDMLLAVVIAVIFSLLFKPVVQALRRRRIPLAVCIVIVMLCVVVILGMLSFILFTGVEAVVEAAPRYQERLNRIIQDINSFAQSTVQRYSNGDQSIDWSETVQLSAVATFLAGSVGSVLGLIESMVLILLFLIFLLSGSEVFQGKIARAVPSDQYLRVAGVLTQVNVQVRRYIVMKTLINIAVGLLTTLILLAFGVDFPLLIGVLTFFLNYIPNIGALIATVLPIFVALLQFESFGLTAVIAGLLIVAHNVIGNLVEPKLLGKSLRLSPLLVLISLLFWGWMWGVMGAVLAVPITSMIKIICENVEPLRPIAVMMSDTAEA